MDKKNFIINKIIGIIIVFCEYFFHKQIKWIKLNNKRIQNIMKLDFLFIFVEKKERFFIPKRIINLILD